MEKDGKNPYPHKFHVSISIPSFIEKYGTVADGTRVEEETVSVAGKFFVFFFKKKERKGERKFLKNFFKKTIN